MIYASPRFSLPKKNFREIKNKKNKIKKLLTYPLKFCILTFVSDFSKLYVKDQT